MIIYLNFIKNPLIIYENEKTYFINSNKDIEEIKILAFEIKFNEKFAYIISSILKESFEMISEISSNESYGPFDEKSIYSEIHNYMHICLYNEPNSIFEFCSNLFYKYLTGHKMKNGNKRLSFLFLINLLNFFGYDFNWINQNNKNYKNMKEKLKNEWSNLLI